MNHHRPSQPSWKRLTEIEQFKQILMNSKAKPALIFKHVSDSQESLRVKKSLEETWNINSDELDVYLLDVVRSQKLNRFITETAGVEDAYPQVLLFADGVTMYDESEELINIKKIRIALKIINRTFRWMETRV